MQEVRKAKVKTTFVASYPLTKGMTGISSDLPACMSYMHPNSKALKQF